MNASQIRALIYAGIFALAAALPRGAHAAQFGKPSDDKNASTSEDDNQNSPPSAAMSGEQAKLMPYVSVHSQTHISAYQGDQVVLDVTATGPSLTYRWMRDEEILCQTARCQIDTAPWGLGTQRLVGLVSNEAGSRFVRIDIDILARPVEHESVLIKPKMVAFQEPTDQINPDDYIVKSLSGTGYIYHTKKVYAIGTAARALRWDEKMRTASNGTMIFGKAHESEFYLYPSSQAILNVEGEAQRVIVLNTGTMRLRELDGRDPKWILLVGGWAQIVPDANADIIVDSDPFVRGRYRFVVMRGSARVFIPKNEARADAVKPEEARVIGAGSMIYLEKGVAPAAPQRPQMKWLVPLLKKSTPEWFTTTSTPGKIEAALRIKAADSALKWSKDALESHDGAGALETLLPYVGDAQGHYEMLELLGRSYYEVYSFERARAMFTAAARANGTEAEPRFYLGLIHLEQENYEQAIKSFDAADDRGFTDKPVLEYYRGVAQSRTGHKIGARNSFLRALWTSSDDAVQKSAQAFLDELNEHRWFQADFYGGAGVDTNVLHTNPAGTLPNDMTTVSSPYYRGGMTLTYEAFHDAEAGLNLGFSIDSLSFLKQGFADLTMMDQTFYLDMNMQLASDSGKQILGIEINPKIGTESVGSDRADDHVGALIKFSLLPVWGTPNVHVDSVLHLDPYPEVNHAYDPAVEEPQFEAQERSKRIVSSGMGLTLENSPAAETHVDYNYLLCAFRLDTLSAENYRGHEIVAHRTTHSSHRFDWKLGLDLRIKNFGDDPDNRSDKFAKLDTELRWFMTPTFYTEGQVSYEKNSSTNELYPYQRTVIGLQLGLSM